MREWQRHNQETAKIFHHVAMLWKNSALLKEEPIASATQEYLKQGMEAVRRQEARNKDEYIQKLHQRIQQLEAEIDKLKAQLSEHS